MSRDLLFGWSHNIIVVVVMVVYNLHWVTLRNGLLFPFFWIFCIFDFGFIYIWLKSDNSLLLFCFLNFFFYSFLKITLNYLLIYRSLGTIIVVVQIVYSEVILMYDLCLRAFSVNFLSFYFLINVLNCLKFFPLSTRNCLFLEKVLK
jgi:hypothetical protein